MLDIKTILSNKDRATDRLLAREPGFDLEAIRHLDEERKRLIGLVEGKKAEQNLATKEIGRRKAAGEDATDILKAMKSLSDEIKELDNSLEKAKEALQSAVAVLPNIPLKSTPVAHDKSGNVQVKTHGDARQQQEWNFKFRNHIEVAEGLEFNGGLDFSRASRMTGSNWPLYRGPLAQLEWALVFFLINKACEAGRELIIPPYAVNSQSMFSSGQFPKFRDQAYECSDDDLVLIPTSEVPLLNLYRNEVLLDSDLPLRLASFTPCFRREAGTYGTGERGLIRIHQFHKVEIFSYTRPEESTEETELMRDYAEKLVEDLELPYRTMKLATGDIAQQAAFTYDIEIWLPGQDAYSEASSVSNCTDYQARRANIRYRPGDQQKSKPEFVHTLNGSALATSRVMVSILENYQEEDGGLRIPGVLKQYMGGMKRINPKS